MNHKPISKSQEKRLNAQKPKVEEEDYDIVKPWEPLFNPAIVSDLIDSPASAPAPVIDSTPTFDSGGGDFGGGGSSGDF